MVIGTFDIYGLGDCIIHGLGKVKNEFGDIFLNSWNHYKVK